MASGLKTGYHSLLTEYICDSDAKTLSHCSSGIRTFQFNLIHWRDNKHGHNILFPRRTTRDLLVVYSWTGMNFHNCPGLGSSKVWSFTCQYGTVGISIKLISLVDFPHLRPRVGMVQSPSPGRPAVGGYLNPGQIEVSRVINERHQDMRH